jgi:hypothetical protein
VPLPSEVPTIAHDLRRNVLGPRRAAAPLLDLAPLLRAARVRVERADLDVASGGCEALLVPRCGDRFAVIVDPTPRDGWGCRSSATRGEIARRRIRFRVMHELAHTLFYSRSGDTPWRHGPESMAEEQFCDQLAASLLLPEKALAACDTASRLVATQRRYDVSLEVAVRAWARVHSVDAALFFWTTEMRPEVQWATRSRARPIRDWLRELRQSDATLSALRGATAHVLRDRQQAVVLATA